MNAKLSVVSRPRHRVALLMRHLAAMSMLALACNITTAQVLAPVVDAANVPPVNGGFDSAEGGTGSFMRASTLGCSGNATPGADCDYGAPLWAGACDAGACNGGACGDGGCGSGCGTGGLLGGAAGYAPMSCGGGCGGGACGGGACGGGGGGLGAMSGGGGLGAMCGSGGIGALPGRGGGLGRFMGGGGSAGLMGGGCSAGPMYDANACACVACCPTRRWRFDVWKEFIYMRSRNTEVAYAVPVDGPVVPMLGNGIQIGPTGVMEIQHETGFRIGASIYGPNCNGLMGQWAHFQSHDNDVIKTTAPDVMRSLVTHPLGNNAASDGLTATADLDIDFDLVDLAFRMPWKKSRRWCAEVIWGLRYGSLNQEFTSTIDFNGTTTVDTDIDFNGIGPRVGMLAQRRIGDCGIYAYSQGDASFLVGSFDAEYRQRNTFSGLVVDNSWESGRVVPQLDYELGVGVMSPGGRCRIRAGYMVSAWFNAVRTNEFINSVQTNNQDSLGDGISFDGFIVHSEMRF